jgi:hypothetical protein
MSYLYAHEIEDRGYVRVSNYTQVEMDKVDYVAQYLFPALHHSKCGWNAVQYKVMETPSGIRTEFLVLWAEAVGNSGSRWINVTGNSLGAIMCAMCDNLW